MKILKSDYRSPKQTRKKFKSQIFVLSAPSGAGKTTVVKSLLRIRDVSDGKIFIDGQDIARVTQESLRQNISLVPQNPILFHRGHLLLTTDPASLTAGKL